MNTAEHLANWFTTRGGVVGQFARRSNPCSRQIRKSDSHALNIANKKRIKSDHAEQIRNRLLCTCISQVISLINKFPAMMTQANNYHSLV